MLSKPKTAKNNKLAKQEPQKYKDLQSTSQSLEIPEESIEESTVNEEYWRCSVHLLIENDGDLSWLLEASTAAICATTGHRVKTITRIDIEREVKEHRPAQIMGPKDLIYEQAKSRSPHRNTDYCPSSCSLENQSTSSPGRTHTAGWRTPWCTSDARSRTLQHNHQLRRNSLYSSHKMAVLTTITSAWFMTVGSFILYVDRENFQNK